MMISLEYAADGFDDEDNISSRDEGRSGRSFNPLKSRCLIVSLIVIIAFIGLEGLALTRMKGSAEEMEEPAEQDNSEQQQQQKEGVADKVEGETPAPDTAAPTTSAPDAPAPYAPTPDTSTIHSTSLPSSQAIQSHSFSGPMYCKQFFDCQTDRLGNERYPLKLGQAICNHEYMFGWTEEGLFQWKNCNTDETRVVFNGTELAGLDDTLYFLLNDDATFQIYGQSGNELLLTKKCLQRATLHPQCLHRPLLDCPYLHLHKSGDVVLNYMDSDGWKARLIQDVFFDLFVFSNEPVVNPNKPQDTCAHSHECLSDRISNGGSFHLGQGKWICNEDFMFGFTADGSLQIRNCNTNSARTLFDGTDHDDVGSIYFVLSEDASFNVYEGEELLWRRECSKTVSFSPECLEDPLLDCPYLHLRKSGDLVLGFVDENNDLTERSMERIYDDIYVSSP